MTEWVQIVSTVGFPIACCGALGFYLKYVQDKNREQLKEMSTSHKEEIDSLKEVLANNTLALQKLTDYLDRRECYE